MRSRLETDDPQLWLELTAADDTRLKDVALIAVEFALGETGLSVRPGVAEAVGALRAGGHLAHAEMARLANECDSYDDRYLDLKYREEKQPAKKLGWESEFGKARALSALISAIEGHSVEQVAATVYEARHSSYKNYAALRVALLGRLRVQG